jgi:CrcB protein
VPISWESIVNRFVAIAIGGALGALARYGVSELVRALWPSHFPVGTVLVNVTGSFILGLFLTLADSGKSTLYEWKFIVVVGFLGAYTTFSTFEYETLEQLRDGRVLSAALNIALSVTLGLIAVWLGVLGGRRIPS